MFVSLSLHCDLFILRTIKCYIKCLLMKLHKRRCFAIGNYFHLTSKQMPAAVCIYMYVVRAGWYRDFIKIATYLIANSHYGDSQSL